MAILIAEQDACASAEAAAALQRAGYVTLEVGTGTEALELARGRELDLLLLEVTLPDMTGYEVCRTLRGEGDEVPIFFLSGTHTDSIDRIAGLLFGADDYLAKPVDPQELVARVRRHVGRRRAPVPARVAAAAPSLTRRENEILGHLAAGSTQKAVALELSISAKTVGTHIQNLLGKLDVHSRAELVAQAYLLGLVQPGAGRRRTEAAFTTLPS